MRFQIFLAILLVFFGVILITAAFFVPRYGLCCKVGHSGKRGGGDKRERSHEDRATAQVLQILPHLHLRLHSSHPRALFLDKTQIQVIGVKVSKCQTHF